MLFLISRLPPKLAFFTIDVNWMKKVYFFKCLSLSGSNECIVIFAGRTAGWRTVGLIHLDLDEFKKNFAHRGGLYRNLNRIFFFIGRIPYFHIPLFFIRACKDNSKLQAIR